MTKRIFFSTFVTIAACAACSSGTKPVDLGENPAAKTGEELSDYAASWDGYAEAYMFPSGSDRVRVVLDQNGDGYVLFGDVPELPPPTDPDLGYPASVPQADNFGEPAFGFTEGFRYPAHAARVQESRLQLGLNKNDLYAGWCSLETPFQQADDQDAGYACVPNVAITKTSEGCTLSLDSGPEPIDCAKLDLCRMICQCTADGCGVPQPADPSDLALYSMVDCALEDGGSNLVGTMQLGSDRITVRLSRGD